MAMLPLNALCNTRCNGTLTQVHCDRNLVCPCVDGVEHQLLHSPGDGCNRDIASHASTQFRFQPFEVRDQVGWSGAWLGPAVRSHALSLAFAAHGWLGSLRSFLAKHESENHIRAAVFVHPSPLAFPPTAARPLALPLFVLQRSREVLGGRD